MPRAGVREDPGMTEDRECLKSREHSPRSKDGERAQVRRCRLRMRPGATVLEARSKGTRSGEAGDRRVSRPRWGTLCPSHPSLLCPRPASGEGSELSAPQVPGPDVRPGPPSHLPREQGASCPCTVARAGRGRPDGPRVLRSGALQASAASRVTTSSSEDRQDTQQPRWLVPAEQDTGAAARVRCVPMVSSRGGSACHYHYHPN